MTFAKLFAIIYAHLVYAIEVIGALIILAFLLDICMKLWSLMLGQSHCQLPYAVAYRGAGQDDAQDEKNRRKTMNINDVNAVLDAVEGQTGDCC